ncbi:uncharacterized protein N7479_005744 [Penicillium vulpinum]|uniref:uncharacterized protein n=1 Tax=Penicillium vulpinum TaxID=29845 RepID=UPI0025471389|nr:uncharacterized protein N7479_005744 [Penicillium vulpinum]KAJ5958594.1 hypothetical protein N7479_005744 [Penicillium vulpinum]
MPVLDCTGRSVRVSGRCQSAQKLLAGIDSAIAATKASCTTSHENSVQAWHMRQEIHATNTLEHPKEKSCDRKLQDSNGTCKLTRFHH